jgi:hypothetical protein
MRQSKKQKEQLHQQGRPPNRGHVTCTKRVHHASFRVETPHPYQQAHDAAQRQGHRSNFHSYQAALEQVAPASPHGGEIEFHLMDAAIFALLGGTAKPLFDDL